MAKKVRFFLKRSSKVEIPGKKTIIVPFHLATVFLLVLMFFISFFLFLRSDLFQIKNVKVVSSVPDCTTPERIVLETGAFGSSIIFYNISKAQEKVLREIYCLGNVKFTKKYPDTLEIEVRERTPIAAIASIGYEPTLEIATQAATIASISAAPNRFFALDKNGIIFKNLSTTSAYPKVLVKKDLSVPGQILEDEVLWLVTFLSETEKFNLNFLGFIKTVEGFFIGQLNEGVRLILSPEKSPTQIASSLQAILKQAKIEGAKIEILDLRFEKPIIK